MDFNTAANKKTPAIKLLSELNEFAKKFRVSDIPSHMGMDWYILKNPTNNMGISYQTASSIENAFSSVRTRTGKIHKARLTEEKVQHIIDVCKAIIPTVPDARPYKDRVLEIAEILKLSTKAVDFQRAFEKAASPEQQPNFYDLSKGARANREVTVAEFKSFVYCLKELDEMLSPEVILKLNTEDEFTTPPKDVYGQNIDENKDGLNANIA